MAHSVDADALKRAKDAAVPANLRVLENFHTFLISFGLVQATLTLYNEFSENISLENLSGPITLYIVFLVTLVPFYQGMNRFLYVTHVERPIEKPNARTSPLLLDVYAFVFMACTLFAMGRAISNPIVFFYLWSALLVIDIIWQFIVWQWQDSRRPRWAFNNLWCLVAGWLYWIAIHVEGPFSPVQDTFVAPGLIYGFVVVEIFRSVRDYFINWDFYFPSEYHGDSDLQDPVYLAGPYTNDGPEKPIELASAEKRLARFNAVTEVAKHLIEVDGKIVYSPLTMTHPIDLRMEADPGGEFWVRFDEAFLRQCIEIYVLKLPGWEHSSGVRREIEFFEQRGIEAVYLEPAEYGISAEHEDFKAAFGEA